MPAAEGVREIGRFGVAVAERHFLQTCDANDAPSPGRFARTRRRPRAEPQRAIVTRDRMRESLSGLYVYGIQRWMKKTLHIDDALLASARAACGAGTDTETVRLGLEALLRRAAYERLRALRGSEPAAQPAPRRREKPARKHRAA